MDSKNNTTQQIFEPAGQTNQEIKQLPVRMPLDVYTALKALAFFSNTSMNEHVVRALGIYLSTEGRDELLNRSLSQFESRYGPMLEKLAEF